MSFVKNKCPICHTMCECQTDHNRNMTFYACPVCGRYEIGVSYINQEIDWNHLASYLVYHRFDNNQIEIRYNTLMSKNLCKEFAEKYDSGENSLGYPIHMDSDIIENWYPKTFVERINYILQFLNMRMKHIGQQLSLSQQEIYSVLFIDRIEKSDDGVAKLTDAIRNEDECDKEAEYMLDTLSDSLYIKYTDGMSEDEYYNIQLLPHGYSRVEEMQKNTSYGKGALVAMEFSDRTKKLREAIRRGISKSGYNAVFIDEVQHNDFITPELLKHIRDSKFVVVDLTHKNNGAYFEEGYAMGLGKPVVQLCQSGVRLHFDIAQKNTIMWEKEDDIPERLEKRIRATID